MTKLLETENDTELVAEVKAQWQQEADALDATIARFRSLMQAAQAEKTALEARLSK